MQKNALTRLTSLYLCLMLTVFLLWPGTSGYAQIAEAKYRLFLWLTGGYCALSVLLWLELALIRRTAAFARPSLAEWLLLGYLLCSLIACLLSPWREETWLGGARHEGLLTIALYVLSFCLVRRFARPAAWMLDVLGAAITLFCAVAVLQLLGKNPFGLYPITTRARRIPANTSPPRATRALPPRSSARRSPRCCSVHGGCGAGICSSRRRWGWRSRCG